MNSWAPPPQAVRLLAAQLATGSAAAAEGAAWPKLPPAKIYKVFAGRTGDSYLTHPTEEIAKFDKYLTELEKKLGDVKFVGGDLIPPAKADAVAAKLKDADALLIIHLSGHEGDAPVLNKLITAGLPTVLFSQPFSGHGWMYFPQWHKQGQKVILLPTSNWGDIEQDGRPVACGGMDETYADPGRGRASRLGCRLLGRTGQEEARRRPGDHSQDAGHGGDESHRSQGRRGRGSGILDQPGQGDRGAHARRRSSSPPACSWRSRGS